MEDMFPSEVKHMIKDDGFEIEMKEKQLVL